MGGDVSVRGRNAKIFTPTEDVTPTKRVTPTRHADAARDADVTHDVDARRDADTTHDVDTRHDATIDVDATLTQRVTPPVGNTPITLNAGCLQISDTKGEADGGRGAGGRALSSETDCAVTWVNDTCFRFRAASTLGASRRASLGKSSKGDTNAASTVQQLGVSAPRCVAAKSTRNVVKATLHVLNESTIRCENKSGVKDLKCLSTQQQGIKFQNGSKTVLS